MASIQDGPDASGAIMDTLKGGPGALGGTAIKTPGLFNFMDLPVEIRLEIYKLLLAPYQITIPRHAHTHPSYPFTGILQTCKQIRKEACPLLYSHNTFHIVLESSRRCSLLPERQVRFLSPLRWEVIASIPSLTLTSWSRTYHHATLLSSIQFTCTGRDLVDLFSEEERTRKPEGPGRNGALSMRNWISRRIMKLEMKNVKKRIHETFESYDSDSESD